jgi:hypothetical protein
MFIMKREDFAGRKFRLASTDCSHQITRNWTLWIFGRWNLPKDDEFVVESATLTFAGGGELSLNFSKKADLLTFLKTVQQK